MGTARGYLHVLSPPRTTLSLVLRLGGDDPQRLGPYRLKAVIGDGGMGRVYLATSPAGRPVAVKVIGPGLANQPGYRERFRREARAAMAVSGLYTASVVDADTAGERPYIATEYVPAPSLTEAVAETGPMPAKSVFALAGGLAEALAAIHRAGLVHRDIKPHNILMAADGPVVIDFGIAVGDETGLTAVGMTVGTPGYIAPEVLHGQDPSSRSDVFSLACVLVYAARGIGPFGTGDPLAIAHRTASGEPDLSGLPADVIPLVRPMLQKDPSRRPSPAQLLQHVALSSNAVLHDGLWLPDAVRRMLAQRKQELQQALGGGSAGGQIDPTAAEGPGPVPVPAPVPGPVPGPQPQPQPQSLRPTVPAHPGTKPSDFAALLAPPLAQGPAPAPTSRSRKGFIALLSVAGVLVMAAAVATVLLVANDNGDKQNTASGNTGSTTTHGPGASSPAAKVTDTSSDGGSSADGSGASDDSSSSPSSSSSSGGSGGSVLSYKPGTYTVNEQVAEDLLSNTVTVDSVTVNGSGAITVKLTYYDPDVSGEWTCAGQTADEATMAIGSNTTDVSSGNDCTQHPSKTWYVDAGQSFSGEFYFSQPPAGSGDWTFNLNTDEFQGSVTDISIPTQ